MRLMSWGRTGGEKKTFNMMKRKLKTKLLSENDIAVGVEQLSIGGFRKLTTKARLS